MSSLQEKRKPRNQPEDIAVTEQVADFSMTQGQPVPQSESTNSREMYPQFQTCVFHKI